MSTNTSLGKNAPWIALPIVAAVAFGLGGWLLGAFLGLVVAFKLLRMSIVRNQRDYEVNKPTCYSCARCCPTCPSDELHEINFLPENAAAEPADAAEPGERELAGVR